MYFWNIHALAEKLRRGSLTERQKMLYLLFYLLIVIFNASIGKTSASPWEISNFLVDGATQAITAVVCFQANSAGDGRNFLERYVCLQVPLTIRFWVVLCSAAVFLGAVAPHLHMLGFATSNIPYIPDLLFLGVLWAYIAYLRSFIAKVAAVQADEDPPAGPSAHG